MVNGIDEVVRLKMASIHTDPELLAACPDGRKPQKSWLKSL